MAYVTRPALLPADFGYSLEEQKSKTVKPPSKVTKKKFVKKSVVKKPKPVKKGRKLPWKV